MNAIQVIRQMELNLRTFATKHPQQTEIVAERTEQLKVLKAEIANISYLEAGLRIANDELQKRKTPTVLAIENKNLKAELNNKTRELRQYTGYHRTECPKPLKQQHSLFLNLFLSVGLPALRKNPEGIPALLASGVLHEEAKKYPLVKDLIEELQKLTPKTP